MARASPAHLVHWWKQTSVYVRLLLCSGFFVLLLCAVTSLSIGSLPFEEDFTPLRLEAESRNCTGEHKCYFQMVADLDKNGAVKKKGKEVYTSKFLYGEMYYNNTKLVVRYFNPESEQALEVAKDEGRISGKLTKDDEEIFARLLKSESMDVLPSVAEPFTIESTLSNKGRGLELSELVMYKNRLVGFCDKTGAMYELQPKLLGTQSLRAQPPQNPLALFSQRPTDAKKPVIEMNAVVRSVFSSGDGEGGPGRIKIEWATVKEDTLYIGSMGKEYVDASGEVTSTVDNYVIKVSDSGKIRYVNWEDNYNKLRNATESLAPGYMIHEAVNWSPHMKRWVFLPRRHSTTKYTEAEDALKGTNKIIIADEKFENITINTVDFPNDHPARGFSSFKFVPGTRDQLIFALRTEETFEENSQQRTYFSIFPTRGGKLTSDDEILVSPEYKFEGVNLFSS